MAGERKKGVWRAGGGLRMACARSPNAVAAGTHAAARSNARARSKRGCTIVRMRPAGMRCVSGDFTMRHGAGSGAVERQRQLNSDCGPASLPPIACAPFCGISCKEPGETRAAALSCSQPTHVQPCRSQKVQASAARACKRSRGRTCEGEPGARRKRVSLCRGRFEGRRTLLSSRR